jgi:phosphoglycolate phosphatase
MAQFSHIIFDLDGTLTDNTKGIGNSIQYALQQMQIDGYSEDILKQFIGPPLQWGFKNLFGMNERNTKLAVEYFREYYSENGLFENEPYSGIFEMLEELDGQGKKMYIATSKLEKYAQQIMEHFEFDKYIIQLNGADYSGKKATKSAIITNLLEMQQIVSSKQIIMIGDTVFDIEGGKENGLSTLAVNYGFGKEIDLQNSEPDFWAEDVEELYEILAG